jgi:hypothetical protein
MKYNLTSRKAVCNFKSSHGFAWLICLFFWMGHLSALHASITVYFIKGRVQYVAADSVYRPLRIGQPLSEGCDVLLPRHAELILRNEQGQMLILKTAQTDRRYAYASIITQFQPADQKGLMHALFSFLRSQLNKEDYDIRDYAASNMRSWGGVVRANCSEGIMRRPINGSRLLLGDLLLHWDAEEDSLRYVLEIYRGMHYHEQASLLYRQPVGHDYHLVPGSLVRQWFYEGDSLIHWVVYPEGSRPGCTRFGIELTPYYLTESFDVNLQDILRTIDSFQGRLLFQAFYYEAYRLLEESERMYQQLIAQYPTSGYEALYTLFLARNSSISDFDKP